MTDTTKSKPSKAVRKAFMKTAKDKAWLKKKRQNASKQAWFEDKAAQMALVIEANKHL